LTVPNGQAQEAVLRAALAAARLEPADVKFIEAHSTGTILGDPIEIEAPGKVYALRRDRANLLWIGSVKANLGHLQCAAGMASLIKVILALTHGELPAQLHFRTPSPFIPWKELPIQVVRQRRPGHAVRRNGPRPVRDAAELSQGLG
jgi:acyl transferase domain-containing protein